MSHDTLSEHLSPQAKAILEQLFNAGDSQSLAVAECLNNIAANDEESASDAFLVVCAQEIRDAATAVIAALDRIPAHKPRKRRG